MKITKILATALVVAAMSSCSDGKINPVSWSDVASTIPADVEFVASVNLGFQTDSALNDVWGKEDVTRLIDEGLALCDTRPSHLVVVGMPKATFVTWPLPSPTAVNKAVEGWATATLNNTVDAHIRTVGKASLIISDTQAWVINNVHGEKYLNDMLSAAMSSKASLVIPLNNCIISQPEAVAAVIPYSGRYYRLELNHDEGQLRLDVEAVDKSDKRLDVVDGLGALPQVDLDGLSPQSPFAAVAVNSGEVPYLITRLAKLSGSAKAKMAAKVVAPVFVDAQGVVLASMDEEMLTVKVPFASPEAAGVAMKRLQTLVNRYQAGLEMHLHDNSIVFVTELPYAMPRIDSDHSTPHRPSESGNPSALAFARIDVGGDLVTQLYFELSPTHGRLQLDYPAGRQNLSDMVEFVKTLIFRTI